ncbi:MAG: hypothetical protein GF384_03335 [Elusimicrobia bacterium]|nr:hypothetical protein [Elusimicrobiota bacterium]MBD3411951.1 hypothetical protein [Elusimicrobiota bacterium]
MNILKTGIIVLLWTLLCSCQHIFPKGEDMGNHLGINDRTNSIVYSVEDNGRVVSAKKGDDILWSVDVIKQCGNPAVGNPAIRHIEKQGEFIIATFGKHTSAKIDIHTGTVECIGAD